MKVAELFARIGLKTDDAKAEKFEKTIKSLEVGLIAAAAAAAGLTMAISEVVSEAFDGAAALKQFESETGASAEKLQKWQAVAEQTNNSAEDVSSAIRAITENQEKIKLGQGNISGYQLLGIDPQQDPFEILEELRDKTASLAPAMKKNVLSMVGVGAGMIQTLELSKEKFDELSESAFIIPRPAIIAMDSARGSLAKLSNIATYLKGILATALAPTIEKTVKSIAKWVRQNEKGIIKTVKKGAKIVTSFAGAVVNFASMIDNVVKSTIGWETAIKGLIGVFVALNASIIASPIGLIIASIILLVAVLDDLFVYSQGKGRSLFGNFIGQFPKLEKSISGFMEAIKDVFKLFDLLKKGDTSGIDRLIEKMGTLGKVAKEIFESLSGVSDAIKFLMNPFASIEEGLIERQESGMAAQDKGKTGLEVIKEISLEKLSGFVPGGQETIREIQNVFNFNSNVQTSAVSPEETGRQIVEQQKRQINNAYIQRSRNQ